MLRRLALLLISIISGLQFAVCAQQASPQNPVPPDTLIELIRLSDAFGNGVEYRLRVTADGTLLFERLKDSKITTTINSKISSEKVAQLISEFEKIDYFSLKDKYKSFGDGCPEVWSDRAHVVTSIRINGKSKSINHYHGCMDDGFKAIYPRPLTELEMKIDEIIGVKQWLK